MTETQNLTKAAPERASQRWASGWILNVETKMPGRMVVGSVITRVRRVTTPRADRMSSLELPLEGPGPAARDLPLGQEHHDVFVRQGDVHRQDMHRLRH